ncbi:M50 family metallopeptidase [Curtobacterium sp. RRHDQ10]|uniref:M50 family metallopeptidase n=1 Tax=Curtobacterium phyllosphaerae TaxID=3413379 RepID=UPI003BF2D589
METTLPAHVFLALLIGAVLTFVPVVGRIARIATTIAHEVGHCIVVVPFGGRIHRITLRTDGSGEAQVDLARTPGSIRWLVRVLNLYAGYSAPLWAGVLLVTGTLAGNRVLTTTVLAVVGLIALVFVRNWFGLLVVIGFDVLAAWVALRPSEGTVLVVAAVGALFVVDGVRAIVQVAGWLSTGARVRTDFHIMAGEYRGHPSLWFILFLVVNAVVVWLARAPLTTVGETVWAGIRALLP